MPPPSGEGTTVFTKSTRVNQLLSIAFILIFGACGDLGGGCGCAMQPLPGGRLPADQTIEGGGQIRVTQAGFQKLTSIIPAVLNDALSGGFCLPSGNVGGWVLEADYCYTNQAGTAQIPDACGNGNGCNVGLNIDAVNVSVTNQQRLNLRVQLDVFTRVPLRGKSFGATWGTCTMHVNGNNLFFDADIAFGIRPGNGELEIRLDRVNRFSTSGLNLSNCGIISDFGNLINDILNSFVGDLFVQLLTPVLNDLVQGFLPDPLGIAGMVDIGDLVGGVSPGTEATMEVRMVPGGYVQLRGGGMSLGLITGLNADEDITTRTPDLDSEPHYCVPPIPAPDFRQPPAALPSTARGTFTLQPANEFLGQPEPADDLAIGISETTLDLGGHHAVTSGAMCLGVGTSLIRQLNLGVFSLLVPSLGNLGDAANPVLLVTRPQTALDFTIGTGTTASPSLTIGIKSFEVDIYVFIYERYTRAFSMRLDMDVGVNLTFDQQPGQPATITPELVGLSADNISVAVLNEEFVAETREQLEDVLPTIFDLAVGLLGDGLGGFEVPSFAGFSLNNLRIQKVTTSEDDFLAIYASLGSSQALRDLAEKYPSLGEVLDRIDGPLAAAPRPRVPAPTLRVQAIDTPAPEVVRAALAGDPAARLPAVTLELPATDPAGRTLEHAWRLASEQSAGLWRPYQPGATLTISDRAFAWQGKYTIEVRSRIVGDYTTTSPIAAAPVIIDSVGPTILVDEARLEDGALVVPARDLVSPSAALRWAWGHPGDEAPYTAWQTTPVLARALLDQLAVRGEVAVWVQDEAGNVSFALARSSFHGQAGEGGCGCDAGGAPTPGGVLLVLVTAALLLGAGRLRRGRPVARVPVRRGARGLRRAGPLAGLWLGAAALTSLVPACNCGGDPGVMYCEVTEDCELQCPPNEIPFCLDGICVCTPDVPYGRIGPFSAVAVTSTGDAWVSAYAETHGDLVVATARNPGRIPSSAWEFVDGVPDGPVVIPDSDIRGGIVAKGPDVGKYTSIAIGAGDTPMVTYFDRDEGSLRFAARYGGVWQIHVIDVGTGRIDPELGGTITGLYSSLTLRSDDGRPGVAYMAQVSEGNGVVRAEVRFAASQSPTPTSVNDWVFWTVDSAVLPPTGPDSDPTPIPGGLGLFVHATRDASQAPILAYYDRVAGALKLARFDAVGGTFAAPEVLDGGGGRDVGWYPSVAVDGEGVIHVSYMDATRDDLKYVNTADRTPVVIDDGYRIVGLTEDGLPKPEFHFVGDDSNMVITPTGPAIIYQDATSHELLYAARTSSGTWQRRTIAGDERDFVGAYGFFASAVRFADEVVISTWVIDQPHRDQWVELFRERIVVD
jgi:hypothetical protein